MISCMGMLRVKNEARWIESVLRSIAPVCQGITVMNDHSEDGTADICRRAGAVVWESPFTDLNEARDKNWLLAKIREQNPDWVLAVDGDEELEPDGPRKIRAALDSSVSAFSLKILYLWNSRKQIRVDGVYGAFRRQSLFRLSNQPKSAQYVSKSACGFHCSNVPAGLNGSARDLDVSLLHFGYMERSDRLRKYAFYNRMDARNDIEDQYRHMVQGDLPEIPAHVRLKYAGPLLIQTL